MKLLKKSGWKTKWFLAILCGVLLVILALFGSSYFFFVRKLSAANERIVIMNFQETEEGLKTMLSNAEYHLKKFSNDSLAWQYSGNSFSDEIQKSIVIQKIINSFDEMMFGDSNLYGMAILSGDGREVVSTVEKKSRTGNAALGEEFIGVLKKCKENAPYVTWISGEELGIADDDPMYCLVNRPVLIGIKAMSESELEAEDTYLLAAVDERKVQQSYRTVAYNGSRAVLADDQGKIISTTDKELLETFYEPREEDQNVEYPLSYNHWKLINMIPKDEYLKEARDIRNMGIAFGGLASVAVLMFCLIWNRRYTRPIQIMMDQMEMVGREQLDIEMPGKVGWPELDHLNEEFYFTVQKLKSYISKLQNSEQEKAREELLALQYQINPHFLYNSLNSIRWMAMMTNNTKVADSLVILCKVITPILRNPSFTWMLRDELDFLENYVKMMVIRYGNEMEYHLECEENIMEEVFPRFILQPVIENCFVHGSSRNELRHIYLRIRKNERFAIEVQNTGAWLSEEKLREVNRRIAEGSMEGDRIGLGNIRKRLNYLYGDRGTIWIESSRERGVLVYICF